MGDRDALIVICWLAIFLLIFFECFYRKLKMRLGRDIEPPPGFNSVSTTEAQGNVSPVPPSTSLYPAEIENWDLPHYSHCIGTKFRPGASVPTTATLHYFPPFSTSLASSSTSGITIASSTSSYQAKGMFRLSMEDEDEEPPPTYEEAVSYAKLITKWEDDKAMEDNDKGNVKPSSSLSSSSLLSTTELTIINLEGVPEGNESELEEYCSEEDSEESDEEAVDNADLNNNLKGSPLLESHPAPKKLIKLKCDSASKNSIIMLRKSPPSASGIGNEVEFESVI